MDFGQMRTLAELIIPGGGMNALFRRFGGSGGQAPLAAPGTYTITLKVGDKTFTRDLRVEREAGLTGNSALFEEDEEPKPLSLDLDQELEKLRKIKDLLAIESAAVNLGRVGGVPAGRDDLAVMDAAARLAGPEIPDIQDLIAGPAAPGPAEHAAGETVPEAGPAAAPEAAHAAGEEGTEEDLAAWLESCRRTEAANGNGEVHYFQQGRVVVADPEKIISAVDRTMEEAQRLSLKLGLTESPKDQFFIKQELINWQEGLRALFLRIIKMCEKNSWVLPRFTQDIVNPQVLRALLERLSLENWSNLEEFALFSVSVAELKAAFKARIEPRLPYLRSLKRDIETE
jgi:hypothetical protein